MRIAIMGTGGMGGFFGGLLAVEGHDVTFIARGAHLRAMLEDGLRVEEPDGSVQHHSVKATDDPATIGPVDFVLFGTGSREHLRANVASISGPPLPKADRDSIVGLFGHLVGVGLDRPDGWSQRSEQRRNRA